jgi:beta-lactamase class A
LRSVGALLPSLALIASQAAAADGPPEKQALLWSKLQSRLEAIERALDGVLGLSIRDLDGGRTLEIRADEAFPTASSIKIAILYELFRQAAEGRISLDEVTRPGLPRVGGDGVLQLLSDRVSLSFRDVAVLMMSHSDNEATNLLIDRLGREAINQRLRSLGLRATSLQRRMMDIDAARRGDENLATPAELRRLMEIVWKGEGLRAEQLRDLRALLTLPKSSPFRAGLPRGVVVADKPGSLDGVRAAVALVDVPGRPYSAAVMLTHLRSGEDGEEAIRRISAAVFDTLDRLARASEHGRILRER